ncbi:MAG: DUF1553 domain-containing protein [Verrucomicrobia bacterium]|nr:DUF1553 domain-containing protein [Verrucomicrobiota bacterium]
MPESGSSISSKLRCALRLLAGVRAPFVSKCFCAAVLLAPLGLTGSEIDKGRLPAPAKGTVDFTKTIKPIFDEHCLGCHGADKQRGGFQIDLKSTALKGGENHAPAIIPGKSADSPLIHFVAGLVDDMVMPQKGERLTAEQIGLLRAWIDQGAQWPDDKPVEQHWSFKPLTLPDIPNARNHRWARNAVDSFILQQLEAKKISPAKEADRRTLIRRVTFDLTGLPPTPKEVEAFVVDQRADAYEKLVDRLLASPHYGERWGRHWLDVVRFAETTGFEVNTPRENAWPYRDYVIRAFNEDKPFDQFIIEQLAGDAFGVEEATGFIVGGPNDQVKSPDIVLTRQQRSDELHDMVATTGSAFLGLTVGCARCHNHKFDPISQVDYFAMTAVFSGVHHGERQLKAIDHPERMKSAQTLRQSVTRIEGQLTQFEPIADPTGTVPFRPAVHPRQNVDRFEPVEAKFVRFTISDTSGHEPCIDELEIYSEGDKPRNVALASVGARATASSVYPNSNRHKLKHINDGLYGNNQSWIPSEVGKGWVQIELTEKLLISKVVWGRDREEKFTDRLSTQYKIEVAMETNQWKTVAGSNDRHPYVPGQKSVPLDGLEGLSEKKRAQLRKLLAEREKLENRIVELTTYPMVYAGTFKMPEPTYRMQRGDPMQPKEEVGPGALTSFAPAIKIPVDTDEQERRIALARWIASPENPLTARTIVNRLWQHHFGEGIVNTPSDLGVNGAQPSHPELLDWLANQLMEHDWKLKPMHRLMLLSSTYRQSSASNEKAVSVDAGNRSLWRFTPRRLEAEPIRDSILTMSGKLDLKQGGPGYHVFEENDNYVRVYEPKKEFGAKEWRRMIYQFKPRMQQDATFGAFDCPDGGQIAPRRSSSITPLQALNLLNSDFMMQQAEFFAERLKQVEKDSKAQVRRAFVLAFNREPSKPELNASTKLVDQHGLTHFCRAILNANEFLYVF